MHACVRARVRRACAHAACVGACVAACMHHACVHASCMHVDASHVCMHTSSCACSICEQHMCLSACTCLSRVCVSPAPKSHNTPHTLGPPTEKQHVPASTPVVTPLQRPNPPYPPPSNLRPRSQVKKLREQYGLNRLTPPKEQPEIVKFLLQVIAADLGFIFYTVLSMARRQSTQPRPLKRLKARSERRALHPGSIRQVRLQKRERWFGSGGSMRAFMRLHMTLSCRGPRTTTAVSFEACGNRSCVSAAWWGVGVAKRAAGTWSAAACPPGAWSRAACGDYLSTTACNAVQCLHTAATGVAGPLLLVLLLLAGCYHGISHLSFVHLRVVR